MGLINESKSNEGSKRFDFSKKLWNLVTAPPEIGSYSNSPTNRLINYDELLQNEFYRRYSQRSQKSGRDEEEKEDISEPKTMNKAGPPRNIDLEGSSLKKIEMGINSGKSLEEVDVELQSDSKSQRTLDFS